MDNIARAHARVKGEEHLAALSENFAALSEHIAVVLSARAKGEQYLVALSAAELRLLKGEKVVRQQTRHHDYHRNSCKVQYRQYQGRRGQQHEEDVDGDNEDDERDDEEGGDEEGDQDEDEDDEEEAAQERQRRSKRRRRTTMTMMTTRTRNVTGLTANARTTVRHSTGTR